MMMKSQKFVMVQKRLYAYQYLILASRYHP